MAGSARKHGDDTAMKFTLSWLKDHLETDAPAAALGETLTRLGLEVESLADRAAAFAPFVTAHVVSAEKHPNADKLRVCVVDTGAERIQVVCGAPNARAGMVGVFAPVGTHIPGTGIDLKKGVIRGVESNGMLVSERELGLSDDHEGIIDLPAGTPKGIGFAKAMGLDDPVFEIKLTPNRPDALGVRGIARDLAAAGMGTVRPFAPRHIAGGFESPIRWRRDLPAGKENACPYVVGRFFRGVTNRPSPPWMQARLKAIGLRPISALVDITNYVSYDLGRPLHVFDADKLAGDLTMRMARAGEQVLALDGKTYTLDAETVVIADARGVHGIGGIMGGELTGCTAATKNVFLEVALFDPVRIAASGRRLGIQSDARYRFERGVDPVSAEWGGDVAAKLVADLCGGEASEPVHAGAMPEWRKVVPYRRSRTESLAGVHVHAEESRHILTSLGFGVKAAAAHWDVDVPSWRPDIEGEADIVEEVVRVHGFEKIPAVPLRSDTPVPKQTVTPQQRRVRLARRALAARGLNEAVTWAFMDSRLARSFGGGKPEMRLANPIAADLDEMRPSILPNLLRAAQRNADRGLADAALFEIGAIYTGVEPGEQTLMAAGVRRGHAAARHWDARQRAVDAFDAKADALAALEAAGAPVASLQIAAEAPAWYHPGRSGAVKMGQSVLAWFGEAHPAALMALDVDGPAACFETFLDRLPAPKARAGKARPLLKPSALQPVERDFAFVVDAGVTAEKLVRAAQGADKALISSVGVFDVYAGAGVPAGKKSVALAVTIQPVERTLTEPELEALAQKIVAAVTKQTGGALRA
jgi:phenylalanyl-tRNA synthetase beta chain